MDATQEELYTRQDIAVMLRGFIDGLCAIPDGLHRDIVEYECTTHFHHAIMDEVDKLRDGQADDEA